MMGKPSPGRIAVAGAGLSGAVIARTLADAGLDVDVFETRNHVAGNCHTERDPETGVLVHVHGPHIFHTDDEEVWAYVNRFERFLPFRNRVKTTVGDHVYSLPVNLHTINQYFGKSFRPDEARAFIDSLTQKSGKEPETFEEQALSFVGRELYDAFFKGYTEKQWGCHPSELPASILKRLPLRFNYDDNYFFHRFQGMPEKGYTSMVDQILRHERIVLRLGQRFERALADQFSHVFYSGPLDGYFDHAFGRLGYRTLDFERFTYHGDYQGCAVMNFGDLQVPYTRVTEHMHFAPWETHDTSVCFREYARACGADDTPYYPIRLVEEKRQLSRYVAEATQLSSITFVGRLGTYRYLDMDVTIREALDAARRFLSSGDALPAFITPPI